VARFAHRLPLRSVLVAACALAVVVITSGAGYWLLRDSSAFAVDRVVVEGADELTRADARDALQRELQGLSLLAVSPSGVAADLRQLPTVRQARVDRDFPATLRVRVWAERPVAVGRLGTAKLLVSSTGRVIRALGDSEQVRLPRVWLQGSAPPQAGELLSDPFARQSVAALAALPTTFGAAVQKAEADREHGIVLTLVQGGVEVRLGPPFDLREKLRAAARMLAAIPPGDLAAIAYLDVRVPLRPSLRSDGGDPETASLVVEGSADAPATDSATGASATDDSAVADGTTAEGAETSEAATESTDEGEPDVTVKTAVEAVDAAPDEAAETPATTTEEAPATEDAPAAVIPGSTAP